MPLITTTTLYDYVNGNDFNRVSSEINFPMAAIEQVNAANYLKYLGRQQWSNISFKQFTLTHSEKTTGYQFTLTNLLESVQQ